MGAGAARFYRIGSCAKKRTASTEGPYIARLFGSGGGHGPHFRGMTRGLPHGLGGPFCICTKSGIAFIFVQCYHEMERNGDGGASNMWRIDDEEEDERA